MVVIGNTGAEIEIVSFCYNDLSPMAAKKVSNVQSKESVDYSMRLTCLFLAIFASEPGDQQDL